MPVMPWAMKQAIVRSRNAAPVGLLFVEHDLVVGQPGVTVDGRVDVVELDLRAPVAS
jgi:hypothetical protein